jgi:alkaline phosphatase D
MQVNRREFWKFFGTSLLTPYVWAASRPVLSQTADFDPATTFPCSVASGDPSPQGAVIWTKVAESEILSAAEPLYFEIADQSDFGRPLFVGEVASDQLRADKNYCVSLDLHDHPDLNLEPAKFYFYRFIYRGVPSRVGRFKTLPAETTDLAQCRFAMLTCQDYSSGYFHALRHLADEDLDFVVHLGDFIYEYSSYPERPDLVRHVPLQDGRQEAQDLNDFRTIYETYRRDPALQRAMEQHAWIITWDDHETANDCYWDYDEQALGVEDKHPLAKASPAARNELKQAAQKAWLEFVPARVQVEPSATNPQDYLTIYRRFRVGQLLDLFMTDTRTYRTEQVCQDEGDCTAYQDPVNDQLPANTMLGPKQKEWLLNGLQESTARWKLWGNQTLMSQFGLTNPLNYDNLSYLAGYDGWDGYQSERRQILEFVKQHNIDRFVVLTGDLHTYLASWLKLDYEEPHGWWHRDQIVGFELMTPSVTSANFAKALSFTAESQPASERSFTDRVYRAIGSLYQKRGRWDDVLDHKIKFFNRHFVDFGAIYYGYNVVTIDQNVMEWQTFHIDPTVEDFDEAGKQLVRHKRYRPDRQDVQSL